MTKVSDLPQWSIDKGATGDFVMGESLGSKAGYKADVGNQVSGLLKAWVAAHKKAWDDGSF